MDFYESPFEQEFTANNATERPAVQVNGLKKTFVLSAKQRKKEKTKEKLKTAVDGLSFSVKKGEIYGLLGPNGAGKTTTLRMLSTLLRPSGGSAEINGFDITKQSGKVREQIGFLTSELKPDEFFTPSYLFDFYAELHGMEKEATARRKRCLKGSA